MWTFPSLTFAGLCEIISAQAQAMLPADHDDYESLPTESVATHMTAGAIAGIMEHCVMYPLDSVKVCCPKKHILLKSM